MASMDKETEEYYNKYFDLFTNDGWKQLIEELKNNATNISNVNSIKDGDDLNFRKGQLDVIQSLLNFEQTINIAHEDASDEEDV